VDFFPLPPNSNRREPNAQLRSNKLPLIDKESTAHEIKALIEKEATVTTVADSKTYADILRDIPALSDCALDVLDDFVSQRVFTLQAAAGREIRSRTDASDHLYVVVAGSASFDAGDGVRVVLEPGDYFGGDHRHKLSASVAADEYVEVLVLTSLEVSRLQHAASRRHHPSNADWAPEVAAPTLRLLPSHRRVAVLAGSGS
jgi:hypothetical protein